MSGRNKWELRDHLITQIDELERLPSFIRSFAYVTVPVYGFFLYQMIATGIKKIVADSDLTDFFRQLLAWK